MPALPLRVHLLCRGLCAFGAGPCSDGAIWKCGSAVDCGTLRQALSNVLESALKAWSHST